MTPILVHDIPELPRWNLYLLFVLWATQVFSTGLSELYTFVSLFAIAYGGTDSHLLEISLSAVLLLNLFPFLTVAIPYEIYQYRTGRLTASTYFNFQIIKTTWVVLASIPLAFMYPTVGAIFLFIICSLPYVGALIYAWRIQNELSEGGVYGKI